MVTSPFLVAGVTAVLVVLLLRPSPTELLVYAAICVGFGAVLPFLAVLVMWRGRHVGDLHVAVREERGRPFVAALASGALGVAVLGAVGAPRELVALGAVYLVVGLALALISLRWKISMHTGVLATSLVCLALLGYPGALFGLLVVPAVLWARAYRRRHTVVQGLAAVLLGGTLAPLAYWTALALLPGG